MAVPKKKTTKSKRNMRRAHDSIKPINVIVDPVTGEYKLPHHISLVDGTYKNRQVIIENNDNDAIDETEAEKL
jgi:large subunit ribosomal protein L32